MLISTPRLMPDRVGLRFFFLALLALFAVCSTAEFAFSQVKVKGYYRKDGTYVRPHYRSSPDGNSHNNWSTKGNVNPYTGKSGTRVTPAKGSRAYSSKPYARSYAVNNPYVPPSPPLKISIRPTDNEIKDNTNINYRGIGFSTTHRDFIRVHPNAKAIASSNNSGVTCYVVDSVEGDISEIHFDFLGDELLRLAIVLQRSDRLEKGIGKGGFFHKMQELYGPPKTKSLEGMEWHFPSVGRTVKVTLIDGYQCLSITRASVREKVGKSTFQFKSAPLVPLSADYTASSGL